jgi:hypothetical protein
MMARLIGSSGDENLRIEVLKILQRINCRIGTHEIKRELCIAFQKTLKSGELDRVLGLINQVFYTPMTEFKNA